MQVDPRLNEIDDSLYRVAVRALIVRDNKILLVKEHDGGGWWAIPGGGIGHGEPAERSLLREIEEELGVPTSHIECDFRISLYNIGNVVNGIPRMNIFFTASVPQEEIKQTAHVKQWAWFTKAEFLGLEDLNPSYDKTAIAHVIFNS